VPVPAQATSRMGFRTTTQADEDIIGIYVYGAREFGIEQAEQYHEGLMRCFAFLAENSLVARERAELRPPVRVFFHEAHAIVYVLQGDDILIIRVLHGRQDWQAHLD